jgi:NAD-dependent deacetylase
VEELLGTLRKSLGAARIVAFTGAGISAESGIPTFRGPNGLWRNFSPEKLASPEAFARDPQLVWEWYDWRRQIIDMAQPNAGHRALAEIERRAADRFTLVTQNVDGLHERAGSRSVVKLHGDIWRVRCMGCAAEESNEQVPLEPLPPHCRCGAMLRPAVVWFGEALPESAWEQAFAAAAQAEVFLVIGTSAMVYPAAGLVQVACQSGARVAIVNPDPTPADEFAEWILRGPAGEILPRLL